MRRLVFLLLVCVVVAKRGKECCSGKPCGDTCISMSKTCSQAVGLAMCKWGNGCACDRAASKAWSAWNDTPKGSPKQEARKEPLFGNSDEPWLSVLHRCFADGFSAQECFVKFMPSDRRQPSDEL